VSGWVVKAGTWYDSGYGNGFTVGDKDYDLASRFALTGSATIAPGWSGGYNITVTAPGSTTGVNSNSNSEFAGVNSRLFGGDYGVINTLYSYLYVKSDDWGTINLGHLSPASDNPAVLADISGTVIESNAVVFEGGGLLMRPSGTNANVGQFNQLLLCSSGVAPGADCFGAAEQAIRYDSPTFGGFRFETSYGTMGVVNAILDVDSYTGNTGTGLLPHPTDAESKFWDFAAFYNEDWGDFKVSAAYAYTWMESNPLNGAEEDYHQVGATLMHVPTGLGIYATGNWEIVGNANNANCIGGTCLSNSGPGNALPDTNSWGVKPFIKRAWNPLGATVIYGEYYQYNDMYGLGNVGNMASFVPNCPSGACAITNSEIERWGAGVVQEIDAAAMHLFARWQNMGVTEFDLVDLNTGQTRTQGFDDANLFQVGGIIFF
jgi:predicted porin